MFISKEDYKRISHIVTIDQIKEAIKHPCVKAQREHGDGLYNCAVSFLHGKIISRLEYLCYENNAELPQADTIADIEELKIHLDQLTPQGIHDYILDLIWGAYKWGYFQGLDDENTRSEREE